jgi:hypothetical protein
VTVCQGYRQQTAAQLISLCRVYGGRWRKHRAVKGLQSADPHKIKLSPCTPWRYLWEEEV